MPTKNTKKKNREVSFDFKLDFNDLTMIESEGSYARVKKLMDIDSGGVWRSGVVKTHLFITSQFGRCVFRLDFHPDRRVAVVAYAPSVGDMYMNPDLRCLSRWCQENGWKVPQPTDSLVKDNLPFWRYMWNTLIVDSEYLDTKYGIRKSLDMRIEVDDDEDEDEL